ncbi:MAG: hypothetical protein ABW100_18025, partial [Candidatus Thiodiazotropha sp. 6PLUC3]
MRNFTVMVFILMISGCATDPAVQALNDEAEVAKRAQERWVLLLDGRLETAYNYLATGYRQVTPYSHYAKKVKGVGLWKSAQVQDVKCKEDVCSADIEIQMEIHHPLMRGPARTESVVKEQWVRDQEG